MPPTIAEVRSLAKKHGLNRAVLFFTTPKGQSDYVSYGATRQLCQDIRHVADDLLPKWNVWAYLPSFNRRSIG